MPFDGEAFGKEVVTVLRGHVDRSLAPILERLAALEARQLEHGRDADPTEVARALLDEVKAEFDALVERGIQAHLDQAVFEIPEPKDGVGLAGAVIDRGGNLVITLTDGTTRDLGPVVGKDGQDGAQGEPGRDGADALGFDDMDATYDGERTITLRFARGDRVKEFAFEVPMVIDRGVYKQGTEYTTGDAVTWGGSYWVAQEPTKDKPDLGRGWRLVAKKGRDGKDADTPSKKVSK